MEREADIFAGERLLYDGLAETGEAPEPQAIPQNINPAFDALAAITDFVTADRVLTAIEAGRIPSVEKASHEGSLKMLRDLMARMIASAEQARAAHAAWNPAEVITQMCLEIETGKYEVKP